VSNRGFARGLSAAQVSYRSESKNFTSRVHRAVLLGGAATCALALGSLPAFAQGGLTIGPGQTHTVTGSEQYDFLEMEPGSTLDFGDAFPNALTVNDNGVNTTWSGTVNTTTTYAGKDDQYLVKAGNGTVTMENLYANGGEIHLSNGTVQQTQGTNTLFILNVGSNVPAAGTATLNISGGTLNIPGGNATPYPAMQVGHFGGTGIVNQTAGTVNFGNASSLNIGNQGGTGTYNISGGTLDFAGGFFTLGRSSGSRTTNSSGTLNISGDAMVDVHGTGASLILGNRESTTTNNTTATISQTGGTLRIRDGATLYMTGKQSATTYNLLGGALEIGGNALQLNYAPSGAPAGTYQFNLGGGTIRTIDSTLNAGVDATLLANTTSTIDTGIYGTNWTGTISGSGNLNKTGSGTLTFTTAQSYAGSTSVDNGKLLLGAAGDLSASSGVNLTGAGAIFDITSGSKTIQDLAGVAGSEVELGASILTAGSARSSTFAGVIQGSGGLTKQGTGTLTLAGANTYSGATNVNAGTLRFGTGGSLAFTSALNVASGASLDIGGAGPQTLSGNVDLAPGSNYLLSLGSGDRLTTTGTADQDGTNVFVRGLGGGFSLATDYAILTAATLSGSAASIDDDMPFLEALLRSPTATQQAIYFIKGNTLASAGLTPNQQAVGGAIDLLPLGNGLFDQLAVLGVADAQAALNSLSGEFHASTKSVLVEQADHIGSAVSDRFAAAFGNKATAAPLAYADDDKFAALAAPEQGAGGLWAHGFASMLSMQDPTGNASDVKADDAGILAGMDFGSDNWLIGFGGGYSKAALASDGTASSGNVEALHALAYIGGEAGPVRIHGGGSYSWNTIDTTRGVVLPMPQTLTANYQARTAQAFGEISAEFGNFRPFAGANYINVATDGFSETGGNAALTVAAGSQSVTFTTVGLRAEAEMGAATAHGMAGWRHAFGDIAPTSAMAIQGNGFTVAGVPIASDAFVAEAGVDFAVNKNVKVGVSYSGQIGADAQQHGAKGTANLRF